MDNVTAAKYLIGHLDLTALDKTETSYSVAELCHRAQTPYGNTAAVCIPPQYIPTAKQELVNTGIRIATVVNFPDGQSSLKKVSSEIERALSAGADEIDAVFPYQEFLAGHLPPCADFLKTCRNLCTNKVLKIILESGEYPNCTKIQEASLMALMASADFIKTSTGKTKISATYEAANIILETIHEGKYNAGFKASGGIRTTMDAKQYLILAEAVLGEQWIDTSTFRIGASSLLDDLLNTIEKGY